MGYGYKGAERRRDKFGNIELSNEEEMQAFLQAQDMFTTQEAIDLIAVHNQADNAPEFQGYETLSQDYPHRVGHSRAVLVTATHPQTEPNPQMPGQNGNATSSPHPTHAAECDPPAPSFFEFWELLSA